MTGRFEEWNRLMSGAFPGVAAPAAMQPPFGIAFEAVRASQEAMMKSIASFGAMTAEAQKRAA